MATITDLKEYVHVEIPGCPIPLIEQKIKMATITFCKLSLAWQKTLNQVAIVADKGDYCLNSNITGVEIEQVIYVNFKGTSTDINDHGCLMHQSEYTMIERDTLRLTSTPTGENLGFLLPRVALKPTITGTFIDDKIYNDYFDVIADGAKNLLMNINKKQWTDKEAARMHKRQFIDGINQAGAEWRKDFSQKTLRNVWSPHEAGNPMVI